MTRTAMNTVLAAVALLAGSGCGKKEKAAETEKAVEVATADAAATGSAPAATAGTGEAAPAAADPKVAEANKAAGEKYLAENGKREGVMTLASGLQYEILNAGAGGGMAPVDGDVVAVDYAGTKIDGVEFDSSRSQGAAARFPIDAVKGSWTEEGLKLMTVGDRYRFHVPPALAFGEAGAPGGPVGPNETLIYDVELLGVTNAARNLESAQKFLAENRVKPNIKTTASGLQYQILTEGPAGGKKPSDANVVRVHYKGTLTSGEEFDSSYARGEPAEFELGRVIAGWTEGVQLMKVGDKFRFFVPPELAYGQEGRAGSPIGPNEALVFEVELLEVK